MTNLATQPAADTAASAFDAEQIEMLRSLRGGALLPQLLRTYREEGAKQIAALKAAAEKADHETLRGVAHSLKSGSYSVGANGVGDVCKALETAARMGTLEDSGRALVAQVASTYARLLPELEQLIA